MVIVIIGAMLVSFFTGYQGRKSQEIYTCNQAEREFKDLHSDLKQLGVQSDPGGSGYAWMYGDDLGVRLAHVYLKPEAESMLKSGNITKIGQCVTDTGLTVTHYSYAPRLDDHKEAPKPAL